MGDFTRPNSASRLDDVHSDGHFDVVLEGGPADLPTTMRGRSAPAGTSRIKVPYLGGYEHFERFEDHGPIDDAAGAVVFRWTMRTKIAE